MISVKNPTKAEYGKVQITSVFDNAALQVLSLQVYVSGRAMRRMGIVQRPISMKYGAMEEVLEIKIIPKVPLRDSSQRY
jgi:hypothetical protein